MGNKKNAFKEGGLLGYCPFYISYMLELYFCLELIHCLNCFVIQIAHEIQILYLIWWKIFLVVI